MSKAVSGVVGGIVGLTVGICMMVPAITPEVVEVPAPAPTVTVTAEPTPTEETAPTKVPAGHRAAAEQAQDLLEYANMSPAKIRSELVDYYEFTEAEAEYAVSQLD